jgi:DNA-binding NarL/FixJ family response regulator
MVEPEPYTLTAPTARAAGLSWCWNVWSGGGSRLVEFMCPNVGIGYLLFDGGARRRVVGRSPPFVFWSHPCEARMNSEPQHEPQATELKAGAARPDESRVIRILIIDENDLVSQTLATSLVLLGFDASISSDWGADGLSAAMRDLQPSVIIVRATPNTLSERLRLVPRAGATGSAVLLLSEPLDLAGQDAATEAGVAGVLATSDPMDRILDAVQFADTLGRVEETNTSRVSALPGRTRGAVNNFGKLSAVESAVLQRLGDGLSPAQIAAERYVSVSTVRSQLKAIYRKLGVRSQVAAVAVARERRSRDTA